MKPLIIYHKSCADGFGAAFAAWLHFGEDAEYLPCQYNDEKNWTFDYYGRPVYILDFSFPRQIMDAIFSGAREVVWLDHHKTSFEMVGCLIGGGGHKNAAGFEVPIDALLSWLNK